MIDIILVADAVLKVHVVVNGRKNILMRDMLRDQLRDVAADKALFIANADPDSRVVVMTLIKQCSVLVTILMGRIVYKEKNIFLRLLCAIIIIAGITISVL